MNGEMSIPTPERLLELIDRMAGQPVAMLADLVADRFVTGTPKRISREAPVLILRYDGERLIPGGGANAVANVAALGGRPLPLGVVGDDAAGRELVRIFDRRGIPTSGILTRAGYHTPTKTRILAGGRHSIKQQIVRYDVEDELVLSDAERRGLLAALRRASQPPGIRVAVLSDYGYGTVEPGLVPRIREILGGEAVLLGDSRYRLGEIEGLDGITPNAEEAVALAGRTIDDSPGELERGGRALLAARGARFVLITRGSDGMSLFTAAGGAATADRAASAHLPVHGTDQVADVTGAGDTVIGTFALALAAGASALEAACLANYAGGVVVMKMGTATLTRQELSEAVAGDPGVLDGIVLGDPAER